MINIVHFRYRLVGWCFTLDVTLLLFVGNELHIRDVLGLWLLVLTWWRWYETVLIRVPSLMVNGTELLWYWYTVVIVFISFNVYIGINFIALNPLSPNQQQHISLRPHIYSLPLLLVGYLFLLTHIIYFIDLQQRILYSHWLIYCYFILGDICCLSLQLLLQHDYVRLHLFNLQLVLLLLGL